MNNPIRVEGGMPSTDKKVGFDILPVIAPDGSIDEAATFKRAVAKFICTGHDAVLRLNFTTPGMSIRASGGGSPQHG